MNHTVVITNAFSINMIDATCDIQFVQLSTLAAAQVIRMAKVTKSTVINAIGHADTDAVVRAQLEKQIPGLTIDAGTRSTVKLDGVATRLVVAQYSGPRLPEGAVELPAGAKIEYWLVHPRAQRQSELRRLEEAWGGEIHTEDSGETDVGGFPIAGTFETASGKVVGCWGPMTYENQVEFPDGEIRFI